MNNHAHTQSLYGRTDERAASVLQFTFPVMCTAGATADAHSSFTARDTDWSEGGAELHTGGIPGQIMGRWGFNPVMSVVSLVLSMPKEVTAMQGLTSESAVTGIPTDRPVCTSEPNPRRRLIIPNRYLFEVFPKPRTLDRKTPSRELKPVLVNSSSSNTGFRLQLNSPIENGNVPSSSTRTLFIDVEVVVVLLLRLIVIDSICALHVTHGVAKMFN